MTEVTNDLMYEVLKSIQSRLDRVEAGIGKVKSELVSVRGHMIAIQSDVHNIYGVLARHDVHFDRIERRLDLRELAEPQRPFDPKS